ncbi:p21-activated protein kinase-interacting protein 1-like protein, partial [Globomyces sp. JEL0801]
MHHCNSYYLTVLAGTITALRFIGNQHLITGSQDGTIGIVRTSDWEHLKSLTGHNGPILAFDAHPSGKVLLSVGKDQTLKCWDLSRAVCSFSMKLSQVPTKVYWSNDGTHFAVFFDKLIQIHCLETGEIVAKLQQQNRINSGTFVTLTMDNLEHQVLVFGGEDKILRILNLKGELIASWMSGHEYRIKDMAFLE